MFHSRLFWFSILSKPWKKVARSRSRRRRRRRQRNNKPTCSIHESKLQQQPSITELLPGHIIITEILSRLPFHTIFTCRSVSKTWLNLISDPHFSYSRPVVELMLRTDSHNLVSRTLHLAQHNSSSNFAKFKLTAKFNLPPSGHARYDIVNSCHGLLCLCKPFYFSPSIVCNPITGEYIQLPKPQWEEQKQEGLYSVIVSGFGFSKKTSEYKVLRMFCRRKVDPITGLYSVSREAEIHTIGSGSWRHIGYAPFSPYRPKSSATFWNGSLHWLCDDYQDKSSFIVAFDFETERFGRVLPPLHFGVKHKECMNRMCIGVLGGYLYISDVTHEDHFEIWVLKEHSWTKEFVVETSATYMLPSPTEGIYQLIKCLDNHELLMFYHSDSCIVSRGDALVSYNLATKSVRYFMIHGVESQFEALALVPSFVSLQEVMGNNVVVRRVNPRDGEAEQEEETGTLFLMEKQLGLVGQGMWY